MKIKLVYWNEKNLGDLLGPYIISHLSDVEIIPKNTNILGILGQMKLLLFWLVGKYSKKEIMQYLFFFEKNILSVGSILDKGNHKSIIWGSGFMNYDGKFHGGKVLAVRGKLSNKKIISQGYKGCSVFGDPALLLPLIISPSKIIKYELVVIPHWSEYHYFNEMYGKKVKVLNIQTDDIDDFIANLTSSRYVLSTSLHGLILSHAYNIPALWIKYGNINTDGFKFYDYFSSVDIPMYDGFNDIDSYLLGNKWKQLFEKNCMYSLPQCDISLLQHNLIACAPFIVKSNFKKY